MNIVEWINQNVYHTTSCDKHRRVLGQKCICGKDKCISELSKPIIEHPDVQKLITQIVILQKLLQESLDLHFEFSNNDDFDKWVLKTKQALGT